MEKIFYTDRSSYPSSEEAIHKILSEFFSVKNAKILRNKNGKPYLENSKDIPLFFSVSHSENKLFIAFSDKNVGIDTEHTSRKVDFYPIFRRFPPDESKEICSETDFLRHWVAKESAVKWLGGTLARDLKNLSFIHERIRYGEIELPTHLTFFDFEGYLIAVCSENNFKNTEFIPF